MKTLLAGIVFCLCGIICASQDLSGKRYGKINSATPSDPGALQFRLIADAGEQATGNSDAVYLRFKP